MLSRICGILLLGVFVVNVYLGLYDTNLSTYQPTHLYLNWLMAVVTLIGAALFFLKPLNRIIVLLAGIVWPVVYVASLAFDVYTKLCFGGSAANCWPSKSSAFNYLILNQAGGAYGWSLAPVIPIAIGLLFIVFVVSIITVYSMRKVKPKPPIQPTAQPGQPKPTSSPP